MEKQLTDISAAIGLSTNKHLNITGHSDLIPSRFQIADAAATALSLTGIAANDIWQLSGGKAQTISVDKVGASLSLIGFLKQKLDDNSQPTRDPFRPLVGFYPTKDDRWVHLHGAFPKLAQGTLDLLNCADDRDSVANAVKNFNAQELEDSLAHAGMCGAMARTRQEWLSHPQGQTLSNQPPIVIDKIADSDPMPFTSRLRPLENIRVLDLTRVLAGPTCGRTLASHGANVLKINSPHLPSVPPFVMDTGHGKRSAFLDLDQSEDLEQLRDLIADCDVFSQGYRRGALSNRGLGPEDISNIRPGIIYVSINAYGHVGPWVNRPGWEQLAQTASGIAIDEGSPQQPQLIGAAATDYTTGYLAACGVMAALKKRALVGGSYHVQVSLAQTANWLYSFGLQSKQARANGTSVSVEPFMTTSESGFGKLHHLGPILSLSETKPHWRQPVVPLGTHPPAW